MPIKGVSRVKARFTQVVRDIAVHRTESAVYAVLSQGAAISDTMTPVDTSFLINSRFSPIIRADLHSVSGRVGYSAEYAMSVHEASGFLKGQPRANGNGNYWDPNGQPKFLERGFEAITPHVPAILSRIYGA